MNSSLSITLRRLEEFNEIYKPENCNLSQTLQIYQRVTQSKEESRLFEERGGGGSFW